MNTTASNTPTFAPSPPTWRKCPSFVLTLRVCMWGCKHRKQFFYIMKMSSWVSTKIYFFIYEYVHRIALVSRFCCRKKSELFNKKIIKFQYHENEWDTARRAWPRRKETIGLAWILTTSSSSLSLSSSISSLLSGWNYRFMSWKIKSFLIYDVRPFFNSGGIQQIFNSRD